MLPGHVLTDNNVAFGPLECRVLPKRLCYAPVHQYPKCTDIWHMNTPPTVNPCSLGFVAQKIFEEVATPAKIWPEHRARRPKNAIFVPFSTSPVPDLVEHRTS